MAATARVVVLMEDAEKIELESRARAAHKSLGAYMRERALGDADEGLDQLLTLAETSTAEANAALDRVLAKLEIAASNRAALRVEARAQAIEEFKGLNQTGLAAMFGGLAGPAAAGVASKTGARAPGGAAR